MQFHRSIKLLQRLNKIEMYSIRLKNTFQSKMYQYVQDSDSGTSKHYNKITPLLCALDISAKTKNSGLLIRSDLYKNTIKSLNNGSITNENLSKNDLVKLLFYIGLQKKTITNLSLILEILSCIKPHLDHFTLVDTCVLANAVFKMAIRTIDPAIYEHVQQVLHSNFDKVIEDTAVLVCFTKVLRQYHIRDYEILEKLAKTHKIWAINFTTKAHILALFAEARYYEPKAFNVLLQKGLEDLKTSPKRTNITSHLDSRLRAKDVARFLWAVSVLGGQLTEAQVRDVIWPRLTQIKEFTKSPALLLDSLLSLAIMGHYSLELTTKITSSQVQQKFLEQQKNRPWIQLQLLFAALEVERPDSGLDLTYRGPFMPGQTLEHHLERRPGLKRLFDIVSCLSTGLDFLSPSYQFQVPPLHIAGVVVTKKNSNTSLHFELLDETVCLHNMSTPIGVMRLKLRLLACTKHKVVTLDNSQLAKEDCDLFMFIEDFLLGKR